jgi:hypothetical protein
MKTNSETEDMIGVFDLDSELLGINFQHGDGIDQ